MKLFDIFVVSATVFLTATMLLLLCLAIYLLVAKIYNLARKRTQRVERDQGYYNFLFRMMFS